MNRPTFQFNFLRNLIDTKIQGMMLLALPGFYYYKYLVFSTEYIGPLFPGFSSTAYLINHTLQVLPALPRRAAVWGDG